jgi:hypothetical protein
LREGEDPQLQIEVGRVLKSLLREQVHARGITAALPQPQRMNGVRGAIGTLEYKFIRRADAQSQGTLICSHREV